MSAFPGTQWMYSCFSSAKKQFPGRGAHKMSAPAVAFGRTAAYMKLYGRAECRLQDGSGFSLLTGVSRLKTDAAECILPPPAQGRTAVPRSAAFSPAPHHRRSCSIHRRCDGGFFRPSGAGCRQATERYRYGTGQHSLFPHGRSRARDRPAGVDTKRFV